MSRYYVNITGIPQSFLDFLGYHVLIEDENFKILYNKGDKYFVHKTGPSWIFVDDVNDAQLLRSFGGAEKLSIDDAEKQVPSAQVIGGDKTTRRKHPKDEK